MSAYKGICVSINIPLPNIAYTCNKKIPLKILEKDSDWGQQQNQIICFSGLCQYYMKIYSSFLELSEETG